MRCNLSIMRVTVVAFLLFQSCGLTTVSKKESEGSKKEQAIQERKLDSIRNAEFEKACIGKTNYYYRNYGEAIKTAQEVKKEYLFQRKLMIKAGFNTVPFIYHREIRHDSILNYYAFDAVLGDTLQPAEFKFKIEQDPMFLLLNKKLPDFKLEDIDGKTYSSSQLMGKPTLINFGGIYCKGCMQEIPRLNKFKKVYGDQINFICILDVPQKPVDLKNYFIGNTFDFYMLKNTQEYKDELKIRFLPYNLFLDKNGIIRDVHRSFAYDLAETESKYFRRVADQLIKQ